MHYDLDFMFTFSYALVAFVISIAALILSSVHYQSSVWQEGRKKHAAYLVISSIIVLSSGYVFSYGLYLLYVDAIEIARALRSSSHMRFHSLLFVAVVIIAVSAPVFFAFLSACHTSLRSLLNKT